MFNFCELKPPETSLAASGLEKRGVSERHRRYERGCVRVVLNWSFHLSLSLSCSAGGEICVEEGGSVGIIKTGAPRRHLWGMLLRQSPLASYSLVEYKVTILVSRHFLWFPTHLENI